MADPILYHYRAEHNTAPPVLDEEGNELQPARPIAVLPGVPLRDLTAADVAELPAHLQASLVACGLYEAVPAEEPPAGA